MNSKWLVICWLCLLLKEPIMATGRITDLRPYKSPVSLDVRPIKKYYIQWSPGERKRLYYLFLDRDGNAAEARVETKAKKFESEISLYNCYNITGYVCDPPATYGRVVDQQVLIIIADRASWRQIENAPIPKQFFSFDTFDMLAGKYGEDGKAVVLTDYLCRIESTSAIMKRRNSNLLKMTVIDLTQKPIEITLWEKIAYTYVNLLSAGKIIAISSLRITRYERTGMLQLESTSATTIDLELAIEGYADEIKSLKMLAAHPFAHHGYHTEEDIRKNITTISDVLSTDPSKTNNQKFSCVAAIREIYAHRSWFTRKCTVCNDSLRLEDGKIICKHCGDITGENITYCVNGMLFDGTAELPVVFFDQAMTQVLGVDCEKLVIQEGYDDPKVLPPPLMELIGKEKIYHFTYHTTNTTTIEQTLEVFSGNTTVSQLSSTDTLMREPTSAPMTPASKAPKRQTMHETDSPPVKKVKEKEA